MIEEEKKYLIKKMNDLMGVYENTYKTCYNESYLNGMNNAYNEIARIIVNMDTDGESNLTKHKEEIIENFERLRQTTTYDCAFTGAIQSVYNKYNDKQLCAIEELLDWLCEIKMERYKISKMELNILYSVHIKYQDKPDDFRINDITLLQNLQSLGYFKNMNFNNLNPKKLHELIEHCEVVND